MSQTLTFRLAPLLLCGLLLAACASPARPPAFQRSPDAFMRAYTEAWNRHESATIAREFYALGAPVDEQTANLERQFEGLRAQGYVRSDIHQILTCLTGPSAGWAGMKFSRLKADGAPLPPKDRASQYDLKWTDAEGWRITRLYGYDAATPLACPAGADK